MGSDKEGVRNKCMLGVEIVKNIKKIMLPKEIFSCTVLMTLLFEIMAMN